MGRLLSRLPLLAGHRVLLHLRAAFCPQPPRGPSALVLSQLITYLGSPFLRASRFPVSRWNIFGTKVAEQKRMEGRNQPGRLLTPFRVRGNWKLDFAGRVTFADVSLSPDSSVADPRVFKVFGVLAKRGKWMEGAQARFRRFNGSPFFIFESSFCV